MKKTTEMIIPRLKRLLISVLISALLLPAAFYNCALAGSVLLGDADRNGEIGTADARIALRIAVQLIEPSETDKIALDVDFNGEVNVKDARLILRAAVGLESFDPETVKLPDEDEILPDEDDFILDDGDILYDDGIYDELFEKLPADFPDAPEIEAEPDTFTFVVYGYGHGVGMTQYGAVAMGKAGFPYQFILSYYYSGTTLAIDEDYPETTLYAGEEINTRELVARITALEIGGVATEKNALKAQAVAVFTLLKKYNFNVENRSSVGIAAGSLDYCSDMVLEAVDEVMGEYVVMLGDSSLSPVLTVYSAACAGSTVNAVDIWHGDNFPVSVASPFDSYYSDFITFVPITSEALKARILAWNPSVSLSDDPAEWIEIISHNASIDENRGYVTKLRLGDKSLSGIGAIDKLLTLRSGCYTVTYTPSVSDQ